MVLKACDQLAESHWFYGSAIFRWIRIVGLPTQMLQSTNLQLYPMGCSYGIGQNNSGQYCSIRMSSCVWSNVQGAEALLFCISVGIYDFSVDEVTLFDRCAYLL